MSATKSFQRTALANLRGILRIVKQRFDTRGADKTQDVSGFTRYIMEQHRVGAKVTDRSKAKALRQQSSDFLAYLKANQTQNSLVSAYRGSDPDKAMSRRAAAQYVGLSIPESVPLGRPASSFAAEYDLAAKIGVMAKTADYSTLTGLNNIKAQYYGAASLLETPLEASVAEESAAVNGKRGKAGVA